MKYIDYYFDFLSPYSYLSWNTHKKYINEWSLYEVKINYLPVTLATIIHFHETKGPAEIPSKRNYLFKDCLRYSVKHEIPFNPPSELPFNSLYALRCGLKENAKENQFKVIDTLFLKGWGEGFDIGNPDVITDLLNNVGLDGQKYIDGVTEKEIRKALKMNVKKAQEEGIFGLPSFIFEEELFWGNDSIEYLNTFVKGEEKLDLEKYNNFVNSYGIIKNEG